MGAARLHYPAPKTLMPARSKRLLAAEAVILLGAVVAAAASSESADWRPTGLVFVLLGLAVASDLLALQHKTQRITAAFFALVLAMALCGPAPAVMIGVVSVLVDSLRTRLEWPKLLTNLATYAAIPLLGGLAIDALAGVTDLETDNLTFAFVVFGAFVLSPERMLQQFGLGLAVAILLDAFVVRCLILPAVMGLLGDRAWWMPGWLGRRLPRLTIEPTPTAVG